MSETQIKIFLRGPFRLESAEGSELVSLGLGEKNKALIAILAMRRGQACPRTYIKDKLWSDRAETQGRNSLRQALQQIRRAVGKHQKDFIITDGGPLALSDSVWVDLLDDSDLRGQKFDRDEILAGINVKDQQFKIWLSSLRERLVLQPLSDLSSEKKFSLVHQGVSIGILPSVTNQNDQMASLMGNLFLERVITSLGYFDFFDVRDFRDEHRTSRGACDFFLTLTSINIGGELTLSLQLNQVLENRWIWGHHLNLDVSSISSAGLSLHTSRVVDQLTTKIYQSMDQLNCDQHQAARLVISGIDQMMCPGKVSLGSAVKDLETACKIDPKGSYFAWHAYSATHMFELKSGQSHNELMNWADELVARALESDPHNPLARTLLTHVYSFLFRDLDRAEALISPLAVSPPDTPLYYYVMGCLRLYQGKIGDARSNARKARQLGAFSPFSHMFSSLNSMLETMSADYPAAIRMGEEALRKQLPGGNFFQPTLRYLTVAYANNGDMINAKRVYKMYKTQAPEFNVSQLDEPSFPVAVPEFRPILRQGFERVEASLGTL